MIIGEQVYEEVKDAGDDEFSVEQEIKDAGFWNDDEDKLDYSDVEDDEEGRDEDETKRDLDEAGLSREDEKFEAIIAKEVEQSEEYRKQVELYPDLPEFLKWSGTTFQDLANLSGNQKSLDVLAKNYDRYVVLKEKTQAAERRMEQAEIYAENLKRDGVIQSRIDELKGISKFNASANIDIDKIVAATADDEDTFRETVKEEFKKAMNIAREAGRREGNELAQQYARQERTGKDLENLFKDLGKIDKTLSFDFDFKKAQNKDADFVVKYRNSEVGKFLSSLISQGFPESALTSMGADKVYKLYLIENGKDKDLIRNKTAENSKKILDAIKYNKSSQTARSVSTKQTGTIIKERNGIDINRAKTDAGYWQRIFAAAVQKGDFETMDYLDSIIFKEE